MGDSILRVANRPIEVTISQVSDRTICINLSPLDDHGQPRPAPESTVLAPLNLIEKLRLRELPADQTVSVGQLHLSIKASPLTFTLTRQNGQLVQECVVDPKDGSIVFRTEAPVFGLGEGRQQFDRRGFFYDFVNGQNTFLATHSATIPVPFLIGTDGWCMFIHNPPPASPDQHDATLPWCQFDLRGENAGPPPATNTPASVLLTPPVPRPVRGRFIPRAQTLNQAPTKIYLSALDQPADAMAEYILLTGRPVMPPKWVMGYIQSHRSLAGPAEPLQIAQTFRDKELPCDALIYLGSGYTNDKNGLAGWNLGHGSLTFNPRTFDQPQKTIDALHALNFKIVLHRNAAPANLYGKSVSDKSDDPLNISNYWATHQPLMRMGIDAWWPDDGDELPIESRLARLRLYYQGPLQDRPNERPWSLNRNGYAGAAKYGAWIWSGDVQSRWATLANHIPIGLNFSMSLSPFWGSDTGGFSLPPTDEYSAELWVRWFQFSTFTPLFRSHGRNWHLHLPWGWNTGDVGPRESGNGNNYPTEAELHNAQVEPICKSFMDLRYRLLPYNYTLMREACDTGLPPMRALWLHYPTDPQAVNISDEYLWGRDILVAPVVEKGAQTRRLYLPQGTWYDWWTGEKISGGQSINRKVDLATLPLFARAGAIIPLDPPRQFTAQTVTDPTTITIYPGADGTFTLYDDDGHSLAYQNDLDPAATWITFKWNDAAHTLYIQSDARMKQLPGNQRPFTVQLTGGPTRQVTFHGIPIKIPL